METLDLRDNEIGKLPAELGLLPLDIFLVEGNTYVYSSHYLSGKLNLHPLFWHATASGFHRGEYGNVRGQRDCCLGFAGGLIDG